MTLNYRSEDVTFRKTTTGTLNDVIHHATDSLFGASITNHTQKELEAGFKKQSEVLRCSNLLCISAYLLHRAIAFTLSDSAYLHMRAKAKRKESLYDYTRDASSGLDVKRAQKSFARSFIHARVQEKRRPLITVMCFHTYRNAHNKSTKPRAQRPRSSSPPQPKRFR